MSMLIVVRCGDQALALPKQDLIMSQSHPKEVVASHPEQGPGSVADTSPGLPFHSKVICEANISTARFQMSAATWSLSATDRQNLIKAAFEGDFAHLNPLSPPNPDQCNSQRERMLTTLTRNSELELLFSPQRAQSSKVPTSRMRPTVCQNYKLSLRMPILIDT